MGPNFILFDAFTVRSVKHLRLNQAIRALSVTHPIHASEMWCSKIGVPALVGFLLSRKSPAETGELRPDINSQTIVGADCFAHPQLCRFAFQINAVPFGIEMRQQQPGWLCQ